jgi:hypothetical protein
MFAGNSPISILSPLGNFYSCTMHLFIFFNSQMELTIRQVAEMDHFI